MELIKNIKSKSKTYQEKPVSDGNSGLLVELNEVNKVFPVSSVNFYALKNINLKINNGDFLAIVGKSGSGKSTLLNLIAGIDKPTTGEIFFNGLHVHLMNQNESAVWRGLSVGVVYQFFQLLPTLTILENVILPMDFCGKYNPGERKRMALNILEKLGIADQAGKLPSTLSGGQQQRAAIARALANDPPLIVADEPTGNLDSKTAENVMQIFKSLSSTGKTIVMVTHETDISSVVSHAIRLSDGEIVKGGIR